MFKKSRVNRSYSSLRQKQRNDDEEDQASDNPKLNISGNNSISVTDLKKKKNLKSKSSAILFSSSVIPKSNSRTSNIESSSQNPSGSAGLFSATPVNFKNAQEYLRELKQQQQYRVTLLDDAVQEDLTIRNANIPDSSTIFTAKKERERKRMEKGSNESSEYISLSEAKPVVKYAGESRFVTEDQEFGGDEVFEDHQGSIIAFPSTDRQGLEKLVLEQRSQMIDAVEIVEDDHEWEQQQIFKGSGNTGLSSKTVYIRERFDTIIPKLQPLADVETVVCRIEDSIRNMELAQLETNKHLEIVTNEEESLSVTLEEMERNQKSASERYEFYQKLSDFVLNLASFLEDKIPSIERLEQQRDYTMYQNSREIMKCNFQDIHVLLREFTTATSEDEAYPWDVDNQDEAAFDDDTSFEELQTGFFADVNKRYSSLLPVQEHFETWKKLYRADFESSYASMSLSAVFEIYIRYEMLSLNLLEDVVDLESMHWHQTLCGFGHDDDDIMDPDSDEGHVLLDAVQKVCIPRVKKMLCAFSIFHPAHTRNVHKLLVQFLDYVTIDSPSFQSLLGVIFHHIQTVVSHIENISLARDLNSSVASQHQSRVSFLSILGSLIENILLWKRFCDKTILQTWCFDTLVNRVMLKLLEHSANPVQDMDWYEQISRVPNDWFESEYHTPSFLVPLADCFENTAVPSLIESDHSESLQRGINILLNLKRFNSASLLAKSRKTR